MNRIARIRTLTALGVGNLARVGLYRLGLRTGLHPVLRASATLPAGPFFREPVPREGLPPPNRSWRNRLRWYDWKEIEHDGQAPDWFANPFAPGSQRDVEQPWWQIPDFRAHDIKNVWELSRFSWLVAMATEAAAGEKVAIERINAWLASWAMANPAYLGPNWKCGQEASIRVIHVLLAALLLEQERDSLPSLIELVEAHLKRIAPTLSYAIGQQNNHGTSEAAAMFAGGEFLARAGVAKGAEWASRGRRLLENRAAALIEPDGSFSQYSVTYHRLMLDTFCFAEVWRRRGGLPAFSDICLERLCAATDWLDAMVDRPSGDAPNIGANDGARLMPLTDSDYRDFRPSLQLASSLFRGARAIETPGPWDIPLRWLRIDGPTPALLPPSSKTFDDGGYHVLRSGRAFAVLRYPRYRFRPSQADALHLDLWFEDRNLLRDAGTFSYNDAQGRDEYFAGTGAHNTVQFDRRDQMPRLGRFLFGEWLKARDVVPVHNVGGAVEAAAGYRDGDGAEHRRQMRLHPSGFSCSDALDGSFGTAILRWRLAPGEYAIDGNRLTGELLELTIETVGASASCALVEALESRYYQQCSPLPCLEVVVDRPCVIVTEGFFKS